MLLESTISEQILTLGNILEMGKNSVESQVQPVMLESGKAYLKMYCTAKIVLQSSRACSSLELDLSLLTMIKYSAKLIPTLSRSSRLEIAERNKRLESGSGVVGNRFYHSIEPFIQ